MYQHNSGPIFPLIEFGKAPYPQPSAAVRHPRLLDIVTITDLDGQTADRPISYISNDANPRPALSVQGLTGLRLLDCGRIPYSASGAPGSWRWPGVLPALRPQATWPNRLPQLDDLVLVTDLNGRQAKTIRPPSPNDTQLRLHVYKTLSSLRYAASDGGARPYSTARVPNSWSWPDA
ncbi:hypothetical protein V5E97_09735 [Singulisphaera sp. Ch08]|uniref:Uncharacterized protein n=1 Tax=Singulisphaera sp. Ch08 TaxID=3120278 RepID=A0AAU7CMC4_9BACT